uniref:Uncharacterized protein n=1 Tax=Nelumbo nucifera TaxID=4432 RepID=A0A822YZL2_NELNU|nr:TPA_asm: hypothetical protein HUJ06_008598 [Nelumbo nucifera]
MIPFLFIATVDPSITGCSHCSWIFIILALISNTFSLKKKKQKTLKMDYSDRKRWCSTERERDVYSLWLRLQPNQIPMGSRED